MIPLYHYDQKFNQNIIEDIKKINAILLLVDKQEKGYLVYNNHISRLDMLHAKRIANSICRSGYSLDNGKRVGLGYKLVDFGKIPINTWQTIFTKEKDERALYIFQSLQVDSKEDLEEPISKKHDQTTATAEQPISPQDAQPLQEDIKTEPPVKTPESDVKLTAVKEKSEEPDKSEDWSERTSFLPDNVKVETKSEPKQSMKSVKTTEEIKVDVKEKMFNKILDIFWVSLYGKSFKTWADLPEDVQKKIKIMTDGRKLPDQAVKELFFIRARNNREDFKAKLKQHM